MSDSQQQKHKAEQPLDHRPLTAANRSADYPICPVQPSVELHIEKLVLDGFRPGDRYRIGEAIELELVRLFVEQGVASSLAQGGEMVPLDAGTFDLPVGASADAIGSRLARAIYQGLNR